MGPKGLRAGSVMKGLLIVPEFPRDSFWSYRHILRSVGRKAAFPPLGLLTFAGYLPDEWDLDLVDLNVRALPAGVLNRKIAQADVVFVTAMSIQKRSLVEMLRGSAAGTDTPVVLGGPFASSYRDQILEPESESDRVLCDGLDVLVWGEAYASMDQLLEWLGTRPTHSPARPRLLIPQAVRECGPGSRAYVNDRQLFRPLDGVPLPRWDLIRIKDYHSMMVQTTAGCPFRCDFCDIIQFNGGFNRPKSPGTVRRELEAILATGYRGSVFSVDDNFIGSPSGISDILDTMIQFQREHGYPFMFYTQASVNLGGPGLSHLIDRMKRAGFSAVFLGIETPDEKALRRMNKKQNLKVDVPKAVARIQAAGIEVYGGFIFGSDEDTPSSVDRIVDFVKGTRIFTAMAGMLTPIPHTPLWERLKAEGRLRPAEFTGNNTDDDVQFVPRGMSPAELRAGIRSILARLFNRAEAYRRASDMIEAVRPHIFTAKRLQLRYVKAAAASLWRQGLRRLDRHYFALLGLAFLLDRRIRRSARMEARRLRRLLKGMRRGSRPPLPDDREWLDRLVRLAEDYLVRFRPERPMEQVVLWVQGIRGRMAAGTVASDDLWEILENARRYLKVLRRQHRFPGASLARAFEAAIKGLHYEKVMTAVVRGDPDNSQRFLERAAGPS